MHPPQPAAIIFQWRVLRSYQGTRIDLQLTWPCSRTIEIFYMHEWVSDEYLVLCNKCGHMKITTPWNIMKDGSWRSVFPIRMLVVLLCSKWRYEAAAHTFPQFCWMCMVKARSTLVENYAKRIAAVVWSAVTNRLQICFFYDLAAEISVNLGACYIPLERFWNYLSNDILHAPQKILIAV